MAPSKDRLNQLSGHLPTIKAKAAATKANSSPQDFTLKDNATGKTYSVPTPRSTNPKSLTVLDNRTNQLYEVPIQPGNTIDATKFKIMKEEDEEGQVAYPPPGGPGLMVYDPAFQNTAVTRSSITYIDGDEGILRYRGYPIEELAEKSTYLEVAFLLIYGELPSKDQFAHFSDEVMRHTFLHTNVSDLMHAFNYDAHPMGMFITGLAAMSTFHPEANPALAGSDMYLEDSLVRNKQIFRILGKSPSLAAHAYRHRIGRPYNAPQRDLSYAENFLYMLDHLSEPNYRPNPKLARALDILFILHADHELNCSTAAMRHIGSSHVDPYSAAAGASAALYGPLHGGANEAVLRMLESIGGVEAVPDFLQQVKERKKKLMGFGHRVYKNYDPRAKIIRRIAYEVFDICGREPLIDVAIALEEAALKDEYFVKRKLYPNVDFYSGLIYKAMGFPTDMFPVLFAIPRMAGWLAHWVESCQDPAGKIWRPRQVYVGPTKRGYVPLGHRDVPTREVWWPPTMARRTQLL
ncbi:citrate synthase-like protein [Piptocephalis cylindrospora]|uniref:Citrate synthase n=1 Tax=Piptocephalis cylindrospora TaxID=1907219 RepID=A0A4P9XY37_9FUNG|nr:citrate synthase-like protein [Piptocephalis cylindrospora]|eukprot:RKP11277.1 citrate synthase-like protein [Piptocephalis cylindrospora]